VFTCLILCSCAGEGTDGPPPGPKSIVRIGTDSAITQVHPRFLSFAVDSSQVVGGNFWSPEGVSQRVDPYDFTRQALKNLTANLKPAYLRIGGSEADVIYYDMSANPMPTAPDPYWFVLNRSLWDEVCRFATDLELELLFTLNAGPGPRDANQQWTPDNARHFIEYNKSIGCPVVLWELGNEINGFQAVHGTDFRIEGDQYAQDMAAARQLIDEIDPGALLAGPSSAFWPLWGEMFPIMPDFMQLGGQHLDVVTWHYYPQQSSRCAAASRPAEPKTLMVEENLDEVQKWADEVESLAGDHAPQAQVWLGETGHAQCGGARGISDRFVGGIWWLDQLGLMAKRGQPIVVRQTLSGSDYGLLNDLTLEPNPDYYNSVIWKQLMGINVLDAQLTDEKQPLRAYSHCTPGVPGGITVLLINLDSHPATVLFEGLSGNRREVYQLTSPDLLSPEIHLNDTPLHSVSAISPEVIKTSSSTAWILLPEESYAFVVFPDARAPACADK
jgi:heparanase 1